MPDAVSLTVSFRGRTFDTAAAGMAAIGRSLLDGYTQSASTISAQLREYLTGLAKQIADRNSGAWPGGTTSTSVSRRSGEFIAALTSGIVVKGSSVDTLEGTLGGDVLLFAHEYGVTISAKGHPYLAIPLPAALNADGTPKVESPRDWDNTFVGMSKAGNLLVFQRVGRSIVPLYALKREIRLPPRLGARQLLDETLPYFEQRVMDSVLARMGR